MPAPKNPNTASATVASVASRTRAKHEKWAAEMRAAGWGVDTPEKVAAGELFATAVDYIVGRLDPDEAEEFWALAEGVVTEDELRDLSTDEIKARRAAGHEKERSDV